MTLLFRYLVSVDVFPEQTRPPHLPALHGPADAGSLLRRAPRTTLPHPTLLILSPQEKPDQLKVGDPPRAHGMAGPRQG